MGTQSARENGGRQESEGAALVLVLVRSILLLRRFTTMAGAEGGQAPGDKSQKSPKDFLKAIKGRHVSVKLNHGAEYKGVLACLDGYMNIAMEQTEEYVDGQLKNKYGDCFIRGNNVLYINASP